ncbi:uncharacterized protein B0H18DRAFT_987775 [Fomitopsis serialis]|uniref:uncharacterized protein n=1 Tax=Fomitopsis serialis TaxID=139415 RepID=UPI002008514C|nr:uncharacterized protein B0H18DRAFT_987775 [Neoantrodia serialis]KAH9932363.1 hypothetical protein B0H18DRAFT_987775 [Neoantrodia serialis]
MNRPVYHGYPPPVAYAPPAYYTLPIQYPISVQDVWWPAPESHQGHRSGRSVSISDPRRSRNGLLSRAADAQDPIEQVVPQRPETSFNARSRSYSQPPAFTRRAGPAPAIRFYHRQQPYYEFTNFAPYPIHWDGRMYPTAEHLFQAHKFMPSQPDLAERIRLLPGSRDALQEAGNLRPLQRADWFDVNVRVMEDVLEAKFAQHFSLRDMLLQTGDSELIEDSPVDSFWGCGQDGLGRNELGKALMRLRDKLRASPASAGARFIWTSPPPDQTTRQLPQSDPHAQTNRGRTQYRPPPVLGQDQGERKWRQPIGGVTSQSYGNPTFGGAMYSS